MATELRTDSSDYRIELLSPAAENGSLTRGPSWRINFDEHRLSEKTSDSHISIGKFLHTISKPSEFLVFSKQLVTLLPSYLRIKNRVFCGNL